MWPNSKGKGGKGSSKSNDGDDEKPRTKPRATRTKLKAMTAEAARALQETGDLPAAKPRMSPEELLEAEIFRAAEQASAEQLAREEQARASAPEFLKIPEQSASLDDQLSGVWKARLMGANKPTPQNTAIPSPANRIAMEAAEKARTNAQHESMIGIVDRMFDQFQNLAYDFNQVASASDLELTWIRPSINRENVGNWHSGSQYMSIFSGRISTRYWTLVVRGSFESITAHIIPADKLLTFSSAPANFMPMFEMMPFFDGAMVYWSAGQKQLKNEDIQQAARAVMDSLVQVAQEDMPPTRPIDLFNLNNPSDLSRSRQLSQSSQSSQINTGPLPVETEKTAASFHEPTPSALGGDIDYSERYRQHFSSDSSSNVGGNPSKPAGQNPAQNNSFNSFRQFPPSQGSNASPGQSFNQMGNQQGGSAQSNSDDWKPVIRSVRGAAGPQPLQQMRQFQNAPTDFPSPSSPNSPITNPPNLNAPMTPPFAAPPGRAQGQSRDDGWRGVDINKSVGPQPGAPSGGKPPFPALPSTPAFNSDSFAGGNSQSFSGQRPAASNINGPATGDDWNFVPVEKDPPKQFPQPGQGDSGARPPVNFPSNLFTDMPASLGFPSSAAPGANATERPNLPPNPSQQAPAPPSVTPTSGSFRPSFGTTKATTSPSTSSTSSTSSVSNTSLPSSNSSTSSSFSTSGSSGTFGTSANSGAANSSSSSSPFSRPFSAVSASKFATPAPEQPKVPPAPQAPTDQAIPQAISHALPSSPPLAPSVPLQEEDRESNPFYTPLTPSVASSGTTSSASPWATAPAASPGGNKADFNPTASSTQSGMLAPPPAPLPSKEEPLQTTFFEPQAPDTDIESEETKTVEIVSVGQFSADRFASEIANQVLPAPILQPASNSDQHLGAPPAVEFAAFAEEPEAKSQPEPEPEAEPTVKVEPESEPESAEESGGEAEAEIVVGLAAKIAADPEHETEQEAEVEAEQEVEQETEVEAEQEVEQEAAEAPELEAEAEAELEEELEEELDAKIESVPDLEEAEVELSEEEQSEEEHNEDLESKSPADEESIEENIDDADEDFTSESELEAELDSDPEFAGQEDEAEAVENEEELNEEELNDDEPSGEEFTDFDSEVLQEQSLVDEDSSFNDSEEELSEDSVLAPAEDADENVGQVGYELASLSEIEEETVESIAELEQELTQSAAELSQSGDKSSSGSSSASPWRGPTTLESSQTEAYSSHVIDSPAPMPEFAPISASLGSSAPSVVAANEHSLKSEIDRVITAFDKELELISTKGSDAFARRDLKGAEHMIKLAEMISEYKSGLAKLKDEYDQDLT